MKLSAEPTAPEQLFSHRDTVVIMLGLMLGLFLSALDQSILGTVLPRISAELGSGDAISWVISAYLLATTAVTPVYGKLSDIIGRKKMLQTAIVLFVLGSLLCALAGSMLQLILFRIVQGIGGGGLMSMAFATVADIVPPRFRGRYQGYFSTVWGVASVLGPVLGGLIADYLDWRFVFWINLPIGIGAWWAAQRTLGALPVKHVRHRIDYLGALLIVAAASCLLLAMTLVGQLGTWNSPDVWISAVAALLLFVLTVVQENRAGEPILPPRLFRNRVFVVGNLVNMFSFMGLIAAATFMPMFYQMMFGLSAANSGVVMIPFLMIWTLSSLAVGQTVAKTGRYKIFPLLGLGLAVLGTLLLANVTPETSLLQTILYALLLAIGSGSVGTVTLVAVQNAVPMADLGIATASFTFSRNLGGAFGVALFATVLIARIDASLRDTPAAALLGDRPGAELLHAGLQATEGASPAIRDLVARAVMQGFHGMFIAGAIIAGLGLLCVFFLEERPLRTTLAPTQDQAASD